MQDDLCEPPIENWFWELLESSHRSLRSLCRKLEVLPRDRLFAYQRQYADAKDYIHPCDWDDPLIPPNVWQIPVGEDFGEWVVSQGRSFYYEVRSGPARLGEFIAMFEACEAGRDFGEMRWDCEVDREEYRGYQCPSMVAFPIFESRFGVSMADAIFTGRDDAP
jgi:hypothetical protein